MKRSVSFFFVIAVLFFCTAIGEGFSADFPGSAVFPGEPLELPSLEHLEPLVTNGPEVLASLSALTRDGYLMELQAEQMSPKAFATLLYGYSDEPVTETSRERYSYRKFTGTVGVSFPLLGTWTRQKIEHIHTEIARSESRHRSDLLTLQNLTALRKSYVLLWVERRRLLLLQAFLADEAKIMELLEARAKKNLLLEADLLEFGAVFASVRRDIVASKVNMSRALQAIALATGQRWSMPVRVATPTLPGLDDLVFNLRHHPEVLAMDEALRLYGEIAGISGKLDPEANLELGVIQTFDFPGTYGMGAFVGVSIQEPFGKRADRESAQLAASADVDRVHWELALAEARLQGNFDEQLLWGDYARETLRLETSRLEAAQESVRERALRHGKIAGDTLEQLVKSRHACLRAAMGVLDAESLSLQTYIELVSMLRPGAEQGGERIFPLEDMPRRETLLTLSPLFALPETAAIPVATVSAIKPISLSPLVRVVWSPRHKAAYVWDMKPFLSEATRVEALNALDRAGFSRILISFTSQEVRAIRTREGRSRLEGFLKDAAEHGVTVDLLLGDPAWITASARGELKDLLALFRPFPFRSVHLDLEPDMLPDAETRRPELFRELGETLRMAVAEAGRPVGISMHPRYFEGELAALAQKTLGDLELSEVALMIYSTNFQFVAVRFQAICDSFPGISFSLAQSVEESLPKGESYFDGGASAFEECMRQLVEAVAAENAHDLIVQSMHDYLEMKP